MSSQQIKTNNDIRLFENKVKLRLMSLPNKKEINVLDCFSGEGKLWEEVKKRTNKKINILRIDKEKYKKISLIGDNVKYLININLSKFDIIDLDSYGSPSSQLEIIIKKNYKGIIHCTFIQTMMGRINNNILETIGYTKKMIKKCPSLFSKNGIDKILNYIYVKTGVNKYVICSYGKKNYFYFQIK